VPQQRIQEGATASCGVLIKEHTHLGGDHSKMYTRTIVVAFLIAAAAGVITADASASSSAVALNEANGDGATSINPSEHIHNLLRHRRMKGGKGTKDNANDNEAKSSKQGNTGTGGGGGTATGSAGFYDIINLPILGNGGTIGGSNGDDESQDGGGDDGDPTTDPNRGDGDDDADEMTGGGSDNAENFTSGLQCGKGILTADGPFETEQCNGSCECKDNCCIQFHVARFCAPRGDNGMSTFGGGFSMKCI